MPRSQPGHFQPSLPPSHRSRLNKSSPGKTSWSLFHAGCPAPSQAAEPSFALPSPSFQRSASIQGPRAIPRRASTSAATPRSRPAAGNSLNFLVTPPRPPFPPPPLPPSVTPRAAGGAQALGMTAARPLVPMDRAQAALHDPAGAVSACCARGRSSSSSRRKEELFHRFLQLRGSSCFLPGCVRGDSAGWLAHSRFQCPTPSVPSLALPGDASPHPGTAPAPKPVAGAGFKPTPAFLSRCPTGWGGRGAPRCAPTAALQAGTKVKAGGCGVWAQVGARVWQSRFSRWERGEDTGQCPAPGWGGARPPPPSCPSPGRQLALLITRRGDTPASPRGRGRRAGRGAVREEWPGGPWGAALPGRPERCLPPPPSSPPPPPSPSSLLLLPLLPPPARPGSARHGRCGLHAPGRGSPPAHRG